MQDIFENVTTVTQNQSNSKDIMTKKFTWIENL